MTKADDIKRQATAAAKQATEKIGDLAHQNRGKITQTLDKVADAVNKKTEGKYADKVAKAKDAANKGADKLAEKHTPAAEKAYDNTAEKLGDTADATQAKVEDLRDDL